MIKLTQDEVQMLIESLDSVGWNASLRPQLETELGRRARKLREKLVAELKARGEVHVEVY